MMVHRAPHRFTAHSFVRGPRGHAARFAARPTSHGRAAMRAFSRAQTFDRATTGRRAAGCNLAAPATGANRNAAGATPNALRSAQVRGEARGHDRHPNAFALRAFSGATARGEAAAVFGNRDFARHRFDPAFLARHRFAGAFWPGPFFWPYAYYDDTFWLWPSAYDEAFWSYGYDDMLRGIYSPYAFADYDEFIGGIGRPVRRARGASAAPPRDFNALCGEAAPGLTDWPADRIVATVQPNDQQRALLDELLRVSDKAAEDLRGACPRSVSVTPVGRLDALEQQLGALQGAVHAVRPALEKFYNSLSDDQKQRFNTLAPANTQPTRRSRGVAAPQADRLAQMCQATAQPEWPVSRIEDAVHPTERQRAALKDLRDATTQAARVVQAACPTDLPLTPPGRLAAMEGRIDALRQGAQVLRPALAKFYAALNDEQKARLNRALGERRTG